MQVAAASASDCNLPQLPTGKHLPMQRLGSSANREWVKRQAHAALQNWNQQKAYLIPASDAHRVMSATSLYPHSGLRARRLASNAALLSYMWEASDMGGLSLKSKAAQLGAGRWE